MCYRTKSVMIVYRDTESSKGEHQGEIHAKQPYYTSRMPRYGRASSSFRGFFWLYSGIIAQWQGRGHPCYSGSALDYRWRGRAIGPAPGAWFITCHLISPGCPQPSIALQVLNHGLKHHSCFFFVFLLSGRLDCCYLRGVILFLGEQMTIL